MSSANEIRDLNKIYLEAVYGGGKKKEEPKDDRMVVTRADKTANTPAYQKYKAGDKAYKAADHLKDDKDWGYDKDGNSLNPVDIEKRKKKEDDLAGSPNVRKEDYETQKKKEVLDAMKRQGRKLSDKDKEKIANKVVTSKGDTSKSDDRYAYEEVSLAIKKLIESGKFSEEEIKSILWNEGYQRDPEGGEEKERQRRRSQKGGDRTEKVRGERTPMPPRGDKRREDFERWYAANVR